LAAVGYNKSIVWRYDAVALVVWNQHMPLVLFWAGSCGTCPATQYLNGCSSTPTVLLVVVRHQTVLRGEAHALLCTYIEHMLLQWALSSDHDLPIGHTSQVFTSETTLAKKHR
jgi:hypothetical protein